jgi:hypothetical protein
MEPLEPLEELFLQCFLVETNPVVTIYVVLEIIELFFAQSQNRPLANLE